MLEMNINGKLYLLSAAPKTFEEHVQGGNQALL